ncbi:MAG TPA: hypothetical protein VFH23_17760 [Jiangellaceae bacterium]|nr:hypothetical protein [Jiangellaceae bacterium]
MPFRQERMAFQPWEYRPETGLTGPDVDLTGYSIAAVDGDIGHVGEATYELGSSYLVVVTGAWIFGRKVLLPAGVVERIDNVEQKVYLDRTKDQIKAAPEYDQTVDDAQYRDRLGGYYAETYNGPDTRM